MITEKDKAFISEFLNDELTPEGLEYLDERLKDPEFKKYYELKLDEKHNKKPSKVFIEYLPMILFLSLIIIGIYLIKKIII